jgi:stage III sporulation protein SpoIIIAA
MACVANCGVSFLATIHAADREELLGKPLFAGLMDMGVFERGIRISSREGKRYYEVEHL